MCFLKISSLVVKKLGTTPERSYRLALTARVAFTTFAVVSFDGGLSEEECVARRHTLGSLHWGGPEATGAERAAGRGISRTRRLQKIGKLFSTVDTVV